MDDTYKFFVLKFSSKVVNMLKKIIQNLKKMIQNLQRHINRLPKLFFLEKMISFYIKFNKYIYHMKCIALEKIYIFHLKNNFIQHQIINT